MEVDAGVRLLALSYYLLGFRHLFAWIPLPGILEAPPVCFEKQLWGAVVRAGSALAGCSPSEHCLPALWL